MKPFSRIEEHNLKYARIAFTITQRRLSPIQSEQGVFSGFESLLYASLIPKTEKDFAIILEQDSTVAKWLRPAQNSSRFTGNTIRAVSSRLCSRNAGHNLHDRDQEGDIETADVQEKSSGRSHTAKTPLTSTTRNGGKPWKYVLIPHNAVMTNMSFETRSGKFAVVSE